MWVSELQAASMGKNSQDHKHLYIHAHRVPTGAWAWQKPLVWNTKFHINKLFANKNGNMLHTWEVCNLKDHGTCTSPCHECCSSLAGLTWLPLCQSKKANQWFEFCLHGHFWLAYVTYMISCLPWKFLATTCKCTSINPWCCFHIFVVLKEKMEVKSMISKLTT